MSRSPAERGIYDRGPCSCLRYDKRHHVFDVVVSTGKSPATGKYEQTWRRHHGTISTARDLRRQLLNERADLRRTAVTLDDLFDRWLADLERMKKAPNTRRNYKKVAATYWRPPLGSRRLDSIQRADIKRVLDNLNDRGVEPSSLRHIRACISSAFSYAVSQDWMPAGRDPSKKIELPEMVKRRPKVPTPADVQAVMKEARYEGQEDMERFLWLGAVMGARNSELRALRLSDIDLTLGIVGIERAISDGQEWTTKNRELRDVGLDEATVDVVRAQVAFLENRARTFNVTLRPDAFLFSDDPHGGTYWSEDHVTRVVGTLFDHAAGGGKGCNHAWGKPCQDPGPLAHFTFRSLRKFMATWGQELGFSVDDTAARAGHTATVARAHYTGQRAQTDHRLSEGLAALLAPTVDP